VTTLPFARNCAVSFLCYLVAFKDSLLLVLAAVAALKLAAVPLVAVLLVVLHLAALVFPARPAQVAAAAAVVGHLHLVGRVSIRGIDDETHRAESSQTLFKSEI
jgi:hypothetical protein